MQITSDMLDKKAMRVVKDRTAHGLMNVEEAVVAYLNALLASGKARTGSGAEGLSGSWVTDDFEPDKGEFPVLIIRLEGET